MQKVPYSDTEKAICDQYKVDLDQVRAERFSFLIIFKGRYIFTTFIEYSSPIRRYIDNIN